MTADSAGWVKLMKFGNHFLYRPGENAADLGKAKVFADKAMTIARKLNKPAWQADGDLLIAKIHREGGHMEEALPFVEKALSYYKKSSNWRGQGKALMEKRAQYPDLENQCKERISIARQAVQALRAAGSKKDEADALRELGDLLQFEGKNLTEAIAVLKQSLAIYLAINSKDLQGIYDLIGTVYTALGVYDEAIHYGILAVKTAEELGDSTMQLSTIYFRLGYSYNQIEDNRTALHYMEKALAIALRHKDNQTIAYISSNIAITTFLNKPPNYRAAIDYSNDILNKYRDLPVATTAFLYIILIRAYDKLGKHQDAQKYLDKLLSVPKDQFPPEIYKHIDGSAIRHYFASRQYDWIDKHLANYDRIAKQANRYTLLENSYLWAFQLDSIRGNYLSAIKNFQHYKSVRDSILSQQKQKQIAVLNIKFDIERKNKELKQKAENVAILTKKSALQQELLEKAQINRNITAAFLILSILFLALLFNRYKIKQRTNLATAENNRVLQKMVSEREWLVRELHHRVKNNLQTIMSLLESQSAYLRDDALEAIRESQHRVQAMSLIHQKLYLTDNLATIEMSNYIWDLTDYLLESFPSRTCHLSLDLDSMTLDVGQAIPIGLILNEAVTNALKYAFPNEQEGVITVILKKDQDSPKTVLSIMDDGVGMPEEFMSGKPGSMGLKLICGLAGELAGKVHLSNENGTIIKVEFDQRVVFEHPGSLEAEMPNS